MILRTGAILVLCLSVIAGGSLATGGGMVLCVDGHGHVAIELPHGQGAAHRHGGCADEEPHDSAAGDQQIQWHGLPGGCSDSAIAAPPLERAAARTGIARQVHVASAFIALASQLSSGVPRPTIDPAASPCCRGGAARAAVDSIRSIVLLV